jgi:hypothetical protein
MFTGCQDTFGLKYFSILNEFFIFYMLTEYESYFAECLKFIITSSLYMNRLLSLIMPKTIRT